MTDHGATHVSPNGNSRVDHGATHVLIIPHLTCGAWGISRVTMGHLTCEPTREMPSKVGYTRQAASAALSIRWGAAAPLTQHGDAASCAALRRGLAEWLVSGRSRSKDKNYRGVRP